MTPLWQQYWLGLLAGEAGATRIACPSPLLKDLLAGGLLAEVCAAAPRLGARLALLASPHLPCAMKLHLAMSMSQDCARFIPDPRTLAAVSPSRRTS